MAPRTADEPEPIGFRRRWMLRRQGRIDGRRAQPDPLVAEAPVVTSMRVVLLRQLAEAVAAVHERSVTEVHRRRCDIEALDAAAGQLEVRIEKLAAEVHAVRTNAPDPNARPVRRLGERHQSEEVVRNRRLREHRQELGRLNVQQRDAQEELDRAQRKRARLKAEIVGIRESAIRRAFHLQATFLRDEALYQRALLARHPLSDLLRPLLDREAPQLPDWTRQNPKQEE